MNPFETKVSRDNVLTTTFTGLKSGFEQWFLLSSDRHWDSKYSDRNLQRKHLTQLVERKGLLIDNGDAFDVMQGRNDRRGSKGSIRPEHNTDAYFSSVIDTAVDWFEPYAKNILLWGEGNHEAAARRHNEICVTGHFVRGMNDRTGSSIHHGKYNNYVRLQFRRGDRKHLKPILMFLHHGSGGNSPVTRGVIQTNRRAVTYPDADIIVTGHIHAEWHVPIPRERVSEQGIIFDRTQHHVSTGTYKREPRDSGWAVERGFGPPSIGATWLRLYYENDEIKVEFTQAQ